NKTYVELGTPDVIGGARGMLDGFASIFGASPRVQIVISDEAKTYRPEMNWLSGQLVERFSVRSPDFTNFDKGDAVYRFFELFDLANVPAAETILSRAAAGETQL